MNIWEILLNLIGWVFTIVLVLAILVFLLGAAVYILREMKAVIKQRRKSRIPITALTDDEVLELARKHILKKVGSLDMFGAVTTFVDGAKFALEAKEEHAHADSI